MLSSLIMLGVAVVLLIGAITLFRSVKIEASRRCPFGIAGCNCTHPHALDAFDLDVEEEIADMQDLTLHDVQDIIEAPDSSLVEVAAGKKLLSHLRYL